MDFGSTFECIDENFAEEYLSEDSKIDKEDQKYIDDTSKYIDELLKTEDKPKTKKFLEGLKSFLNDKGYLTKDQRKALAGFRDTVEDKK